MKVTLYHCDSVPEKLNKDLTQKQILENVVVKGDIFTKSTPSIMLYNVGMEGVDYIYIEDIDTYFFITDIEYHNKNMVKVTLAKDLLMTYKNEILASYGIVTETDTPESGLFTGSIPVSEEKEFNILSFSDGKDRFTDNNLYLTVAN